MDITTLLKNKKAIFVELDDVLFPEKDYDLQVFYLFAQFVELTEQVPSKPIIDFLQQQYRLNRKELIFETLTQRFDYLAKYQVHFNRLFKTARIPLKLLMYKNIVALLTVAVEKKAQIFVVTEGEEEIQLNKIRHIEWGSLSPHIKLFFVAEFSQTRLEIISKLLVDNSFAAEESLLVLNNKLINHESNLLNLPYVLTTDINKLI